jgi:hypothetical protein
MDIKPKKLNGAENSLIRFPGRCAIPIIPSCELYSTALLCSFPTGQIDVPSQ